MIHKCLFGIYFLLSVNFIGQFSALATEPESEINYGIVRYVKGDTFILPKGEKTKKSVKGMDKFFDGCEIITGVNSFAILRLPDGSTLKLDPETNLKVEGLIQKKGNGYKGSSYLILTIGGVMVDVVKKFSGPPSLEIETVNQVAFGVRGTTFYIFHDKETSDVWGTVRQGQVMAMDYGKDDSEAIEAGMSMAVVEGQILTKPHKYHWAEKLKWSFTEKDGELDTRRESSMEARYKELQSLYKKLRNRSKKEFVKEKKAKQKSIGNGYRTSTGEYESHDASLFRTQGGGAGYYPTEEGGSSSVEDSGYQDGGATSSPGGSIPGGGFIPEGSAPSAAPAATASPVSTPLAEPTVTPAAVDNPSAAGTAVPDVAATAAASTETASTTDTGGTPDKANGSLVGPLKRIIGCHAIHAQANPEKNCPMGTYPIGETFGDDGGLWNCCVPISMEGDAN
ncbi:MAG: hypothetical protein A2X86_19310 [Bdellovibrionales bacterium GWA2_49_15]|nr:MAG: hypothetical protein A2X86_19310 [Bdellovibrionales bacterium GWA2_49_15]HAZ14378.1 hypothetical protein [Bdellovibrionales bacterium]